MDKATIFRLTLAPLCAVYIAVRLWGLADACLWFDEIFGVHAAEHSWNGMWWFAAQDLIHPPLFYALLKIWIGIGGDGLLWLRLFPVLFSVLALVPFLYLCRELSLRTGATAIALGLIAVNGALIKYAQEVRMYSLLLCLSLFSIWLFSRYFFRGKSFWMLVLANVLLVNTHYFGWFVVVSEVAAIVILQRIKILQTLLMFGVTAAGFVPWVIALFRYAEPGSSVSQNIGWMKRPGIAELLEFGFDLADPFYFQQSSVDPSAKFAIAIPLAAVTLGALAVYLVNFKNDENKERTLLLFILGAVPVVLIFILSWLLPVSIWGSRHLLIVFVPAILLISIFLTEIKPVKLSRGLIALTSALVIAGFVMQLRTEPPRHIWCAWEPLAVEWVTARQNHSRPKRLYVFEDLVAYHYWFATRSLPNYSVSLVKGIEGVPNDPAYFLPRGFDGVKTAELGSIGETEIWVSFRKPTITGRQGEGFLNDGFDFDRLFDAPVTSFENLGYTVEDVKKEVRDSQTAYLVRMIKDSSAAAQAR